MGGLQNQPAAVLELEGVSKHFGSTQALRDVRFDLRAGEVHALAGENGAGKSTLIRILSGVYTDFTGSMRWHGTVRRFGSPQEAAAAGIAAIHQELSLIGSMTVADNLLLGRGGGGMWSLIHRRERQRQARAILAQMALDIDPEATVESLPLCLRQLVEIARALARDAQVIIMDEPTSSLNDAEAALLFDHIERLVEVGGRSVVYISHRLDEIFRLAQRITVLRDGLWIDTVATADIDQPQLITKMLGRAVDAVAPRGAGGAEGAGDTLLLARGLTFTDGGGRKLIDGVSLSVGRGEILGLAGLVGSGTSELLHGLFGALGRPAAGELTLAGRPAAIRDPAAAIAQGLMLLSADRRATVLGDLSVIENVTLSSLDRFGRWGWLGRGAQRAATARVTRTLNLDAPSLDAPARQLSGGNQQKVALGRCVLTQPQVLLLDQPTRGIDVGAKQDVYRLIRRLAAAEVGIIVVASEPEELLAICDRVLVLARGRVTACLDRSELSTDRILEAALSSAAEPRTVSP